MGHHASRVGQDLHLFPEREVRDAQVLPNGQFGYIHGQVLGNVVGKTFDLDLTQDEFEDPALHLDALRLAGHVDGDLQPEFCFAGDSHYVYVEQFAMHWIHLPLAQHDARGGLALDFERKDGVMARLRGEDRLDGTRVHRDGNGQPMVAVKNGRNAPGAPHPPGSILSEFLPRLGLDVHCFSHKSLLPSPRPGIGLPAKLLLPRLRDQDEKAQSFLAPS